jgi:predicted GH43/DUF377 family glycosyl hydrolase
MKARRYPWRPARVLLRALIAAALLATGLVAALAGPARADYTASNLPNWAIGPFTRSPANPILTAPGTGWDAADVYNPGVVVSNGKFEMLFRGQNNNNSDHISQVGYATSTNGTSFTPYSGNPVITNSLPSESHGIEDPRLYYLNGTWYSFFTGYTSSGITLNEATSANLVNWTQLGPVEPNDKDAAVVTNGSDVPVLINGKYVMYYGQNGNGTFIAYSTDMIHWSAGTPVNLDFPSDYTPWELCVAVTDYPTIAGQPDNTGILLFDAGTLMSHGRWYYAISEVDFSGTSLTQETGQLTDTVLSPSEPYEINGQTPRTLFMNSITYYNGQWYMYYGGGDSVIGLATAPLRSGAQPQFSTTSLETGQRLPDWVDSVDTGGGAGAISNVGGFPGYGLTGPETGIRYERAHTGTAALLYSGDAKGGSTDYAYTKAFDLSADPVKADSGTTLSYWIYPQSSSSISGVTGDNSTCAAVDMIFSDGTALRNSGAVDQNGNRLHPAYQCGHLKLDQWNYVTSDIGAKVAGKTIVRIDVGYDQPGSTGGYRGYIDDISLTG